MFSTSKSCPESLRVESKSYRRPKPNEHAETEITGDTDRVVEREPNQTTDYTGLVSSDSSLSWIFSRLSQICLRYPGFGSERV